MRSQRMRRVDALLQRELSSLCEREVVSQLSCLLTITQVKTSADLRHAQVFYSVLGDDAQWAEAEAALDEHRVSLQAGIARAITLKYTPVLNFKRDTTLEQADRVFSIIDELDLPPDSDSESE